MPDASSNRPDIFHSIDVTSFDVVENSGSWWQRFWDNGAVRKAAILIVLAIVWESYARWLGEPLLFPTLWDTAKEFVSSIRDGELPRATWYSVSLLLKGYVVGLIFAGLLTAFATFTRIGADFLETLTSMFNPLPSIALLPLALIWFTVGDFSIIFVLVHAVLWSVALNAYSGFRAVNPTLKMVGQNYGLSGLRYLTSILVPGAFPSILTGLKVGWAFAWRTLIAAELVFGASSRSGGLGVFIFKYKSRSVAPKVFAGLLTVILFGLFVENVIFKSIEKRTVRRWGMQT